MSLTKFRPREEVRSGKAHSALESRATRNLPVICISSNRWADLMARPQQLMLRYSQRAPVLFVEPLSGFRQAMKSGILRPRLREVSRNMWTLSVPTAIPIDSGVPITREAVKRMRTANDSLTRLAIGHAANHLNMEDHILWCMFYGTPSFKRLSGTRLVIYDCMDDWSAWYESRPDVLERELELISKSDLVFTVSQSLFDTMKARNPHTHLVRNGVDYEHFEAASRKQEVPAAMEGIARPIVGFYGRIDTWVALDLIGAVAKRRTDWSFVLIGPVDEEFHRHSPSPNVRFLGRVPYSDLPQYAAQFDVCIIPFRRTAFAEGADPIKMYEYLATGKPIVSTGFPEARKFGDLAEIADDAASFEQAISRSLGGDTDEKIQERQRVAKENSWDKRVETVMSIINDRRKELGV